jgi:hypothetical protein
MENFPDLTGFQGGSLEKNYISTDCCFSFRFSLPSISFCHSLKKLRQSRLQEAGYIKSMKVTEA